jgi:hypothetical protein
VEVVSARLALRTSSDFAARRRGFQPERDGHASDVLFEHGEAALISLCLLQLSGRHGR